MNTACDCFTLYWDGVLVGFDACLYQPSGNLKYAYRSSRTVVLPDYQNLGFGSKLNDFVGEYYLSRGYKFYDRASHLRFITHWDSSPYWRKNKSSNISSQRGRNSTRNFGENDRNLGRVAFSAEYMGKDYATKPHLYIYVDDNDNINYASMKKCLLKLKCVYWICVVTGEINTYNEIETMCLSLGIRTQLLYSTIFNVVSVNNDYVGKKIITSWDSHLSDWYMKNIDNLDNVDVPDEYCAPVDIKPTKVKNSLW